MQTLTTGAALALAIGAWGLAPASVSADPPLRPATIEDLAALRELGGPFGEFALSPDGGAIAVIERETDLGDDAHRFRLVLVDTDAVRPPQVIADAGGFILRSDGGRRAGIGVNRAPQFSPDGAWIYYLKEREGAVEIWRTGRDGARSEQVVRAEGDVRRFRVEASRLLFETMTPRSAIAAQRAHEERFGFRADDAFTPSYSLRPLADEESGRALWSLDLTTGALTRAMAEEANLLNAPRAQASRVAPLDPDSRVDEPAKGLFFRGESGEVRCAHELCAGALSASWDRARPADAAPQIVFMRLEGHARAETAFYAWRPAAQAVRLIRRGEERFETCAIGEAALYCTADSTFQPRRLVRIELATGALTPLYDPNPQWADIARPRVERFDYADAEGNESFAHLVYPLGWRRGRAYPLVIAQYRSRGFLLGGVGDETPIFPLSARGYFVLSFDRPEFRARAARMSRAELQRAYELDGSERAVKREALNFFIARAAALGADRNRIAITGLSDGAETVYAMLMDEPIFAAAVVSTPPTDPIGWALQSPAFRQRSFERIGLTGPWPDAPEPWRSWWERNSPVFHVERIRAPILFNLAEAEAIRAFPLITRLREADRAVEAYIYPGAYHLKWRPQHIFMAQRRTMDWLDFWLRGVEREDEHDPGRLARWRALRADRAHGEAASD